MTFKLDNESSNVDAGFTASIACDSYDDEIFFGAIIFSTGVRHVYFTFDRLDCNLETLLLINDFNESSNFFKAYRKRKINRRRKKAAL